VLTSVYVMIIAAAVAFLTGVVVRIARHKEATMWWRGAMGLLAFANTLLLLEIYLHLAGQR
jgi:hypothetical protein